MNKYHTHFCLSSNQTIPNITPTLDKRLKPQKVVLLTTPDMRTISANLQRVYKYNGISAEILAIDDPYDIDAIFVVISDFLEQYEHSIVLNITGGTKPMAIAAQQAFSIYNKDIFYVKIQNDELIFLQQTPSNIKATSLQLEDSIKIRDYLESYAIQSLTLDPHRQIPPQLKELSEKLIRLGGKTPTYLSKLNYYASKAETGLNCVMSDEDFKNSEFGAFLDLFIDPGLFSLHSNRIKFADKESRFFCNGGWLEMYIFLLLRGMKKELGIQDLSMGLEVQLKSGTRNELDIIFLANNAFYIIECKTVNYKDKTKDFLNTLYKLDTIKNYGGIRSKAMLVSYHPIRNKAHLDRAKDYGIEINCSSKLANIASHLKKWIKSGV